MLSYERRGTRDPNYIESRVERFTRNFIRDRHRHSTHIECNEPRRRAGLHRDRSRNPQIEKLPQGQQRRLHSSPPDIQPLGQQKQRFGRKAHTLAGKKCTRHDPNQSPAGQVDDMNPQIPHTPPESDIQAIVAKLKTPSKPQLQSICVVNGLPKTGNKADLSHRIEKRKLLLFLFPFFTLLPTTTPDHPRAPSVFSRYHADSSSSDTFAPVIRECAAEQDNQRYQEVRDSIYRQTATMPPPYNAPSAVPQPPAAASSRYGPAILNNGFPMGNGVRPSVPGLTLPGVNSLTRPPPPRSAGPITPGFQFKSTPFYDMKLRLGEIKTCEGKDSHDVATATDPMLTNKGIQLYPSTEIP